jgi:hypothetical protein
MIDDNGISCFIDDLGVSCWVDDLGQTLCCLQTSNRGFFFRGPYNFRFDIDELPCYCG